MLIVKIAYQFLINKRVSEFQFQLIKAGIYRKLLHYVFQLCTFRFTRTLQLTTIEK